MVLTPLYTYTYTSVQYTTVYLTTVYSHRCNITPPKWCCHFKPQIFCKLAHIRLWICYTTKFRSVKSKILGLYDRWPSQSDLA